MLSPMDQSVDEATQPETLARRWEDAGRLIERVAPDLFAAMVAAAEATALEISAQPRALIS